MSARSKRDRSTDAKSKGSKGSKDVDGAEMTTRERGAPGRSAHGPGRGAGRDPGTLRVLRWPALIVLPLLVVGAVLVERRESAQVVNTSEQSPAMPVAAGPGSLSSTWYCTGGTTAEHRDDGAEDPTGRTTTTSTATSTTTRGATGRSSTGGGADGRGLADPVVVIANAGEEAVSVRLSVYPSEGDVVTRELDVEGASRTEVIVHDIVSAPYVAVLVEADAGQIGVSQEVRGADGRDVSACASAPSTHWYFPAGTTRAGTEMILSVFNPFPADAVLDISFDTDDGVRTPQAFQGLVVPGGRVVAVDVSSVVTLREQVATAVSLRSGRVVVSRIQSSDGSEGSVKSLDVTLGAPDVATGWVFPDGVGGAGYSERFVLYNPGETTAEAELFVELDDPEVNGIAEPFSVRVPAGRHAVVDVFADGRVPPEVAHTAVVRVNNAVGIAVEREITGSGDAAQPGRGYTIGSPMASSYWLAPVGSADGASGVAVIVSNPFGASSATVTVESIEAGRRDPIAEMGGVEIAPGARRIFVLQPRSSDGDGRGGDDPGAASTSPAISLAVISDRPVVVETRFGFDDGDDLSYLVAEPVRGALSWIDPALLWVPEPDTSMVVGG